jgi:rSAM/selenodomain-associated transferase 2/rSAM/selenodomain-associated transferase 1
MTEISISVIIPVLNDAFQLKKNLKRLFDSMSDLTSVEVIICDGGSRDHSVLIARQFACQVISSAPGRAHQMNAASQIAKGDWLLFLHADTILPVNWTNQLNCHWGFFPVHLNGQHWFFRIIEKAINLRSRLSSIGTGDQALFFKRAFFTSLHRFPSIPIMEDIAISKKARQTHKPCIAADSVITSSRRWEQKGMAKTVILMWWLRFVYWLGINPNRLHQIYYPKLSSRQEPTASLEPMPVIQVFAKPPVEGMVKTRLIPGIGASKAAHVFRHCLTHTLGLLRVSHCPYQIWLSEETQDSVFQQETYHLQQGNGLGDKMLFALQRELSKELINKVLLIGSDCLDINQSHFDHATTALDNNDIVLLPTFDGGFALIGCRVIDPLLFHQVQWSTSLVLQQTIDNAQLLNYQVHLLEMVRDIDTLSDLGHYPNLLSIIHHKP